jgi:hypothetical protein
MQISKLIYILFTFAPLIGQSLFAEQGTSQTVQESESDPISIILRKKVGEAVTDLLQKKTVSGKFATLDFPGMDGKISGFSDLASNTVLNSLVKSGKEVVDRATLDRVLNEQRLQQSQLLDPSSVARVGKFSGASAIILGYFNISGRVLTLTIRILNVETAQFIAVEEIDIKLNDENLAEVRGLVATASAQTEKMVVQLSESINNSTVSPTASTSGESHDKSAELDKAICQWIAVGKNLADLIRWGQRVGLWTKEDLHSISISNPSSGWSSYQIQDWTIQIDNGSNGETCPILDTNSNYVTLAHLLKKTSRCPIVSWKHANKVSVQGNDQCLSNPDSVYNNEREGPTKTLPKKI